MRHASPLALTLLVAMAALAVPAPAAAQTTVHELPHESGRFMGVEIPMSVDTFGVSRARRGPRVGLGATFAYFTPAEPQARSTVYVFNNARTVREEFDGAYESIRQYMVQQGDSATVTYLDDGSAVEVVGTDGATYTGLRGTGEYEVEGRREHTMLYVFEKGDQLVKFRISVPASTRQRFTPHAEALMRGILGGLDVDEALVAPDADASEFDTGRMRIDGIAAPMEAEGLLLLEVRRQLRAASGLVLTYGAPGDETAPAVQMQAIPRTSGSLEQEFPKAYAPWPNRFRAQGQDVVEAELEVFEVEVAEGEAIPVRGRSMEADLDTGVGGVTVYMADLGTHWHAVSVLDRADVPVEDRGDPRAILEAILRSAADMPAGGP